MLWPLPHLPGKILKTPASVAAKCPVWNTDLKEDTEDRSIMDMRKRLPRLGTRDLAEMNGLSSRDF